MSPFNLDINATYGVLPGLFEEVADAMSQALNPSSVHTGGQIGRALIDEAREVVVAALEIPQSSKVIFTSGGTEANALALTAGYGGEVLTTTIEHPSIIEQLNSLYRMQILSRSFVPVESTQEAFLSELESKVTGKTRLISVMMANNETGALLPLGEVAKIRRSIRPEALLHTDATQGLGKVPISVKSLSFDLVSFSGHKIGAFPGIGALIVADSGIVLHPLLNGGSQEGRLRAGTENLPGIISFAVALKRMQREFKDRVAEMAKAKDYIEHALSEVEDVQINHSGWERLPNTISVTIPRVSADDLVVALDLCGIRISSGAACSSGKPDPSHVLTSIGISDELARQTVRISVNSGLSHVDIERITRTIVSVVKRMRGND